MASLRTWSGRQALAGLVAVFIALQAIFAGLHAASIVNLQLFASEVASSICHGRPSENGAPVLPASDHGKACCLLTCNAAIEVAKLVD